MLQNMKTKFITGTMLLIAIALYTCKHEPPVRTVDPTPVPGPVGNAVCFQSDVLPIFQTNCAKADCHDAASRKGDIVLDSYANIMRRKITPGSADNSKIYRVLFETGNDKMPPPPNPDLTAAQKAIIAKWINEGAKNTINCASACDSNQFRYSTNVNVVLTTFCTGCHSGVGASGNVDLSTYTSVRSIALSGRLVGAITHAVGYSPMPKGAAKLSDCQIAQVRKWIAAGALNN
jgi:hypothetical protein